MRALLPPALVLFLVPSLASGAPALTMSSSHLVRGGTVTVHAAGFTPGGGVLSHLVRPDGTEYPEATFRADPRGEFSHLISIILTEIGTYELQMIDEATNAAATTRFMVLASPMPEATKVDGAPASYAGVWFGQASKPAAGGPRTAPVLVSLSGGGRGAVVGTIAYPSSSCGGELWLIGVRGDAVQLGEHITYGEERCESGDAVVSVTVRPDGRLQFERRTAEEPQGTPAAGLLNRR